MAPSRTRAATLLAGGMLGVGVLSAGMLTAASATAGGSPAATGSAAAAPSAVRAHGDDRGRKSDGDPWKRFDPRGSWFGALVSGRALHGEIVVQDRDGTGVRTVLAQRGEVTATGQAAPGDTPAPTALEEPTPEETTPDEPAPAPTTLTVKSADGFVTVWTLTDDTKVFARKAKAATTAAPKTAGGSHGHRGANSRSIADVAVGDQVIVSGVKATGGATATVVFEPRAKR